MNFRDVVIHNSSLLSRMNNLPRKSSIFAINVLVVFLNLGGFSKYKIIILVIKHLPQCFEWISRHLSLQSLDLWILLMKIKISKSVYLLLILKVCFNRISCRYIVRHLGVRGKSIHSIIRRCFLLLPLVGLKVAHDTAGIILVYFIN